MTNNGYWFGRPFQIISTSTIGALRGQQSAVFLQSAEIFFLRSVWLLHCCTPSVSDSVHLFGSSPLRGWTGSLPGATAISGYRYVIGRAIANFILWKAGNMWKIVSQAQALLFRVCVVRGFGSQFSACSRPFGSTWVHIQRIQKQYARSYYTIPNRCRKQHLSTSPSNHVIAVSSSLYRFPWFATYVQP